MDHHQHKKRIRSHRIEQEMLDFDGGDDDDDGMKINIIIIMSSSNQIHSIRFNSNSSYRIY